MVESARDILGFVFNIQRFSLHDGPGIRTLVFLKGCPLNCIWCANPEGLKLQNQVLLDKRKCTGCADCMVCPEKAIYEYEGIYLTNPELCKGCGECVLVCRYKARKMSAKQMSATEVVDICERDASFFADGGGGLTLGGGEPLFQTEFALEILKIAKKRNINTAIETTACVKKSVFLKAISLCETVFIDIKAFDDNLHKQLTGTSNRLIYENISFMDAHLSDAERKKIIFRIPLIPDHNCDKENIIAIGTFIKSLKGDYPVEILPFHNFGESKYEQLCIDYKFKNEGNMKEKDAFPIRDLLAEMGMDVKINTH